MDDPDVLTPEIAENFKDQDPTRAHEWESAPIDQMLTEAPAWSGIPAPGAFPDYESETRDDFTFPPVELLADSVGNPGTETGFEDREFSNVFSEHPGIWDISGRPSRVYTPTDITNMLVASTVPIRPLMQGSGLLYGVSIFSVATAVTPFTALTDSLDGIGPVLMLIANNVVQSGYLPFGPRGIEFKNGLTLANLTGAQLALIPIIQRRRTVTHKPTGTE